jgi:hypothetical protein
MVIPTVRTSREFETFVVVVELKESSALPGLSLFSWTRDLLSTVYMN